ncbi:ATP-binding protein (plasmid) [Streptomyces sp. NBC_00445]|uniref:AAA family ATPase n=1 Tax=Streptomyces sp. NBC_00445 TaxID=2975745 RepID=UPI002E21D0C8
MIVQLAGLPGTGKSTLAADLTRALGPTTLLLDKDRIRDALFGPHLVTYTRDQDDFCVRVMHQAAARHFREHPRAAAVLDGRTCSRRYQIEEVQRLAEETEQPLRIIECVCPDEVAARRLQQDLLAGTHPAANRDHALHRELKARAEPIALPVLRLDTSAPLPDCTRAALTYLSAGHAHAVRPALKEAPIP